MSIEDWIEEWRQRVYAHEDEERKKLLGVRFAIAMFDAPDARLSMLDYGRQLAQQLDERWWMLYFDHWRIQTLLYKKGDYTAAREIGVTAVVEARQPHYAQLPQRTCLHEDIIRVYLGIDAQGYAEEIHAALTYMETQVTPDVECSFCHRALSAEFALARQDLAAAKKEALHLLSMSQSNAHHMTSAYRRLCEIAYQSGDWRGLLEWSSVGEQVATRAERWDAVAELLGWQALVEQRNGDKKAARRLYRAAIGQSRKTTHLLGRAYYDALCGYHELDGAYAQALELRRQELDACAGKGKIADECRCRLAICRLLQFLGQPFDAEGAAVREVAQHLKDPAPILKQLMALEQNPTPGTGV